MCLQEEVTEHGLGCTVNPTKSCLQDSLNQMTQERGKAKVYISRLSRGKGGAVSTHTSHCLAIL